MTDSDDNDLLCLENTPAQVESLLYSIERAARGVASALSSRPALH